MGYAKSRTNAYGRLELKAGYSKAVDCGRDRCEEREYCDMRL